MNRADGRTEAECRPADGEYSHTSGDSGWWTGRNRVIRLKDRQEQGDSV